MLLCLNAVHVVSMILYTSRMLPQLNELIFSVKMELPFFEIVVVIDS